MKIVLSRLDRVGDLILSTPAIASVRRSWPGAHVTIACSAYNAVVMERNADVDAIVVVQPREAPEAVGKRLRGCDLALALAPCSADMRLAGATCAPIRVGYTYRRRYLARITARAWLTKLAVSEADPDLAERPGYRVRHEVDQVLDLVGLAGGSARSTGLVLPIEDTDRHAVAHVPSGGIAFQLAPRWFRDGSTLPSAIALLRDLRRLGLPVVVTYGIDALEGAAALRAANVADAVVGGLAFSQWAAIFEKSRLVVTVDTGATHVASATRRPTVVLFEHRYFQLSSQEWSPYGVPSVCLRKPATGGDADLAASRASVLTAVETLLARTAPTPTL